MNRNYSFRQEGPGETIHVIDEDSGYVTSIEEDEYEEYGNDIIKNLNDYQPITKGLHIQYNIARKDFVVVGGNKSDQGTDDENRDWGLINLIGHSIIIHEKFFNKLQGDLQ